MHRYLCEAGAAALAQLTGGAALPGFEPVRDVVRGGRGCVVVDHAGVRSFRVTRLPRRPRTPRLHRG